MGVFSQKMTILALRSPALLVALMVLRGDCSNIRQTLLRIIMDAGWSSDAFPHIAPSSRNVSIGARQLGLRIYNSCNCSISRSVGTLIIDMCRVR